jgi:hypothetical protein
MRIDEEVNITGQSRKGTKRIRNPVKRDTRDMMLSIKNETLKTHLEVMPDLSIIVAASTTAPMKTSSNPSMIHSIVMMR